MTAKLPSKRTPRRLSTPLLIGLMDSGWVSDPSLVQDMKQKTINSSIKGKHQSINQSINAGEAAGIRPGMLA
uniref:Uncharacterized protein n=1 Tax=Anguilla anguilla TaxID=7936 RepID=A0A0E9TG98_ANGAN